MLTLLTSRAEKEELWSRECFVFSANQICHGSLVRESWTSMGLTKIKRIVSSGARMNTILSSVIVQVALADTLVAQLRAA